jgi:hypothetical protein
MAGFSGWKSTAERGTTGRLGEVSLILLPEQTEFFGDGILAVNFIAPCRRLMD